MAKKMEVGLIVVAGLAIIGYGAIPRALRKQLKLGACFENVQGLREGAAVRIAGIEVGRVARVRAHPDRRDCPAEVLMVLSTPDELKIPNDATAQVESEGLLGPECVAIKVENASGPPATDHTMLKTVPTVAPSDALREWMGSIAKRLPADKSPPANPPAKQK